MHYAFKVIIAGDGGVGKTTLVNHYIHGDFREDTRITLGVQFMVKRLNVDGDLIDLQIWDFGGEDRFRFILPAHCRGAHGAIYMYDITSPASLYHIEKWLQVLRSQGRNLPLIVGGTKADLAGYRKVPIEEAVAVANRSGIANVVEVSAKTGQNVEALFETLCQQMIKACQSQITNAYLKPISQVLNVV